MQVEHADLADCRYVAPPPWIKEFPSLNHFDLKGNTIFAKLPFAGWLESTPQTDAVVEHVIRYVVIRGNSKGCDKSRRCVAPAQPGVTSEWVKLCNDVLRIDCQVSCEACFRMPFMHTTQHNTTQHTRARNLVRRIKLLQKFCCAPKINPDMLRSLLCRRLMLGRKAQSGHVKRSVMPGSRSPVHPATHPNTHIHAYLHYTANITSWCRRCTTDL